MKRVTRKLHNARGATFVFALAVFLIMALFSFTIVNASLSGVRNAHNQQEREQAYLTVDSAARLLQASLLAEGMKKVETEVFYTPSLLGEYELTAEYSPKDDAYTDIFQLAAIQLVKAGDGDDDDDPPERMLTVKTDGLADVSVTLTMKDHYSITAVLADDDYTMSMTLEARPVPTSVSSTETISPTEGEGEDQKTVIDGYKTTTVTTTTFTWVATSVRGGEA